MTSLVPWLNGRGGGGGGLASWWSPFSTDIWDPFSSETNWGQRDRRDETSAFANAQVDWRETDTAHEFRVDLPGVRKEEVKVQVEDGNILQISGEREVEDNDKWHRVERRRGSFIRLFRLPEDANLDEIKCSLDHGVLKVIVPKKDAEQKKNVRYIDIAYGVANVFISLDAC